MTLVDYQTKYLAYAELTMTPDSLRNVRYAFRALLKHFNSDTRIATLLDLNAENMEMFLLHKFKQSKTAASLFYRVLRSAMNKAQIWHLLDNNPLAQVKLPRIPKKRPVYMTDEQFKVLLAYVNKPDLSAFYQVAFNTGLRLSELSNLKWSSVDMESRVIHVRNDASFMTKSKCDREVPMNDTVYYTLLNLTSQIDTYVFKRYHSSTVSHMFKKYVRKAQLPEEIHFHSLRHSTASRLVQRGVSLYIVKEILGHSSYSTTQIYAHLNRQSVHDAVNLL